MGLSFTVYGKPQPQGSHKAVPLGKTGRATITDSNESLPGWRNSVLLAARAEITAKGADWVGPLTGPIHLRIEFWLHRPVGAPKTRDIPALKKPDVSKLIRAVEDACTDAGVWADDSQVVEVVSTKQYAVSPTLARIHQPGVHQPTPCAVITIEEVE